MAWIAYVTGRVPEHDIGQACINYLRKYGLDTSYIARGGERLAILYTETGHSQRPSKVIYDRNNSAFSEMKPGTLDWETILRGKDWLHFTGTAPAMGEGPREELLRGLKLAKQLGVTVSVDYNYPQKALGPENGPPDDGNADGVRGCRHRQRRGL